MLVLVLVLVLEVLGVVEEDGGGVVGDGEGFAGGEGGEGGAGEAEGPAVVGVGSSEVVARVDRLLHEAAPLLAPPHRVLVFQLRRRATHGWWWWRVGELKVKKQSVLSFN